MNLSEKLPVYSSSKREQEAAPATVYQQDINAWKTTTITVQSIDFGALDGNQAWLVGLALQFSCPHDDRFKKANIMFQFERTALDTNDQPRAVVVKRWAPQSLTGRRTTSSLEWSFEGSLALGVDIPHAFTFGAEGSVVRKETTAKDYSCSIVGDTWKAPHVAEPNAVRFYIHENELSKGGIPNRLNVALIVQSESECQGWAVVETNGIKARVKRGHCNPIELKKDIEYRPRLSRKLGEKDFADLGIADWQVFATTSLQISSKAF